MPITNNFKKGSFSFLAKEKQVKVRAIKRAIKVTPPINPVSSAKTAKIESEIDWGIKPYF